jgi:hypothetical protein
MARINAEDDAMLNPGRKLDDGLLADHWQSGRDEAGQPVALTTESPIYLAWVKDHYGDGPLRHPWGVPQSQEQDFGTGDITQVFTNGVAVYSTSTMNVTFRRQESALGTAWADGQDASDQAIADDPTRPIQIAWTKDQQGKGPFGEPWGAPRSQERDHGDGRVTQLFDHGVATHFIHEPDAEKRVVFNERTGEAG